MRSFEEIFNWILIAIMMYQAVFFFVQYAVLRKPELFYYCMCLLCLSVYYFAYILAVILKLNFVGTINIIFTISKFPSQFITHFFYIMFIIHYLELQKTRLTIYKLCLYYKYYNLLFSFIFLLLGSFQVPCSALFHLVTLVLLLFSIVIVVLLWRVNNVY